MMLLNRKRAFSFLSLSRKTAYLGLAFLCAGNLVFPFSSATQASPVLALGKDLTDKTAMSCDVNLEAWMEQHLAQPHLQRTRWGIDIRQYLPQTSKSRTIYQKNTSQLFLPASTAKLFSALTLSGQLDENYRLTTQFLAEGPAPKLKRVTVVGQGDPSILGPQLDQIVQRLKAQGISSIDFLTADSRAFAAPWIIPSWEWEDLQTSDGVPITSLSFSQNSLPLRVTPQSQGQPLKLEWLDGKPYSPVIVKNESLTVAADAPEFVALRRNLAGTILTVQGHLRAGASPDVSYVAIANPEEYFLARLRSHLKDEGIKVGRLQIVKGKENSAIKRSESQRLIAELKSPPLSDLLKEVNQSSNNFYTESLLRHWAWRSQPEDERKPVTPYQSLKKLEEYLETLEVDPASYELKDASGLSRQNLVSPESLTSLLEAAQRWKNGDERDRQKYQTFMNSLAVAGESGTLKRRLVDTPISGRFRGKTGTLRGTVTLAGILDIPDQPSVLVTIMANQSDQSSTQLRKAVDAMILQLEQSMKCSGPR